MIRASATAMNFNKDRATLANSMGTHRTDERTESNFYSAKVRSNYCSVIMVAATVNYD